MVFLPARCQTKAALAPGSMNTRIALDPLEGVGCLRLSVSIFTALGQEGAAQVEVTEVPLEAGASSRGFSGCAGR